MQTSSRKVVGAHDGEMIHARTRHRDRGQRRKWIENVPAAATKEQVAKHTSAPHMPDLENTYTAATVEGKFWSDKRPVFAFETFLSFLSGDFQHSWLSGMLAIMVASHLVYVRRQASTRGLCNKVHLCLVMCLHTLLFLLLKRFTHRQATSQVVSVSQMHITRNESNRNFFGVVARNCTARNIFRTKGG